MKKIFVLALIIAIAVASTSCSKVTQKKETEKPKAKTEAKKAGKMENESSHFGFMPATFDYQDAKAAGGNWDRPFFELFGWGQIEPEPGTFDFSQTDQYVKEAQDNGFNALANIQPFAAWDQKANEGKFPEVQLQDPRSGRTRGKPTNMGAYKSFVKKLVERYDGDGKEDMPSLKYPIKYWEAANEPEMQNPPLVFFQGPPKDYFEVLKATYEAIKSADENAKVLNGGMAGMQDFMTKYWQGVFDLGGGNYFDIANIHSISHGEPLNIPDFKDFLARNKISKPIWVTEVQIEDRQEKKTEEEYADSLARSYTFALANGAEKLFYVNLKLPEGGLPGEGEGGPGFSDLSTLISKSGQKQPLFDAHKTIAERFDQPFTVEKVKEEISAPTEPGKPGGARKIQAGQYKFTIKGKTIFALWGSGAVPAELTGKVKVTYMNGEKKEMDASAITLSESPILAEKL